MTRIAYVTVTIPVSLEADEPHSKQWWRNAALENFLDHPAIQSQCSSAKDLDGYVDKIHWEEEPEKRQEAKQ